MRDPLGTAGHLVRRERLRAGLTQAEMGRRAGMPQSAVARIELGGVSPTVRTLRRLLDAADCQLLLGARRWDAADD
jgi:transcriptional regulator with XRE-family HTH domain